MLSTNRSVSSSQSSSNGSFLNSTPASLKGSFLRNKLENPIFRSFFNSKKSSSKQVFNSSDLDSEGSELDSSEDEGDRRIELERDIEPRWSLFRRRGSKSRPSFFERRGLFSSKSKRSPLRNLQNNRLSSDSSKSESDSSRSSESDNDMDDIDTLTKLEASAETCDAFLLYTHKGEAVRAQFFSDYLLLTPIEKKRRKTRQKNQLMKKKATAIYYEDLALWTNNDECLKLVHISKKHTALQERSEIKLFVNKKKVEVRPSELNEILKDKVSILLSNKLGVGLEEARKQLEQSVTETDVDRVVEEIDREGEKRLAKSFANTLAMV